MTTNNNTAMSASPLPSGEGGGRGRFFSLAELIKSDTAVSLGIDNTPSKEQVANLELLVHHVLDPLRQQWGAPLRVNSGYRCPELNTEVCGVEDSYHLDGCAADISTLAPSRNMELMALIRTMHLMGIIRLTECYLGPSYRYVHVAYSPAEIDESPFI